ncbi:MAG: acetylglutamate kinase [Euryarchaeota archaeon]|nr:acetylglutamate kinase [Euryarchaeota archaeon]
MENLSVTLIKPVIFPTEMLRERFVVIKIGGHALEKKEAREWVAQDVILLRVRGLKPVIVHGGGPEISDIMKKLGKEPTFVEGLRVTDEETMDLVEMTLIGKVNTEIVSAIQKFGGKAVGLSGKDAAMLRSSRQPPKSIVTESGEEKVVDLGLVGEIEEINTSIIEVLCNHGYIPVVAPIGINSEGKSLNINADIAAGEIAAVLEATKLIILTDVPGVLRDLKNRESLISELTITEAKNLIKEGIAGAGMVPKIDACIRALEGGVEKAHIVDGKIPHVILSVFTERSIGTTIVPEGV